MSQAHSASSRPGAFPHDLDSQVRSSISCSSLPRTLPTYPCSWQTILLQAVVPNGLNNQTPVSKMKRAYFHIQILKQIYNYIQLSKRLHVNSNQQGREREGSIYNTQHGAQSSWFLNLLCVLLFCKVIWEIRWDFF